MKKRIVIATLASAFVCSTCVNTNINAAAATKTKQVKGAVLVKNKASIKVGKTTKIKLKNASQKVKWKVKNKKLVKITKKSGKKNEQITVKGIKSGTAKIVAEHGKNKFTVTIKVQESKKKATENKEEKTTVNATQVNTPKTEVAKTETTKNIANKITAEAVTDKVKAGENLKIRYTVTGNEDKSYHYDEAPGTLERLESDKWVSLNKKATATWKEIGYVLAKGTSNTLEVPLEAYYEGVTAGHYRYTKNIGENAVSVEFEVVQVEATKNNEKNDTKNDTKKEEETAAANKITAEAVTDKVKAGENLKIRYTVTGNEDKSYHYDEAPGTLERLESDKWVSLNKKATATWKEIGYVLAKGTSNTLEVPLEAYYEGVTAGHYRYTKNIGENAVSVEFEVVEK